MFGKHTVSVKARRTLHGRGLRHFQILFDGQIVETYIPQQNHADARAEEIARLNEDAGHDVIRERIAEDGSVTQVRNFMATVQAKDLDPEQGFVVFDTEGKESFRGERMGREQRNLVKGDKVFIPATREDGVPLWLDGETRVVPLS